MFSQPPPFSFTANRYDLNTFKGRCYFYANAINPLICLENERTINQHRMLLERVRGGEKVGASDAELWRAREAVEACVHPTTQKVIPAPFRMCAFIPINIFVVPYMMLPSTILSPTRTIAVQLFNQSYNCAINYANRSSDAFPMSELLQGYAAAVVISVSGALGATAMLKKLGTNPSLAVTLVRGFLPFTAVCAAAIANLAMMRQGEWAKRGIVVKDEDGTPRGNSLVAAKDSLFKCSVTRVAWNLPSMVIPTLLMYPITAATGIAGGAALALETSMQITGLAAGVPPALAVYPVTVNIKAQDLEPEYRNLKRKDGTPVETFTYYKGL